MSRVRGTLGEVLNASCLKEPPAPVESESSGRKVWIALGMGVGAAAVAGYAWWRYWSQSASEPAPVKSTAPALPREDVIRFFQDLTERMQQVIVRSAVVPFA
jgi:hypothetical protein